MAAKFRILFFYRVPSLRANQLPEELLEVYEEAFYLLDPNDSGAVGESANIKRLFILEQSGLRSTRDWDCHESNWSRADRGRDPRSSSGGGQERHRVPQLQRLPCPSSSHLPGTSSLSRDLVTENKQVVFFCTGCLLNFFVFTN